MIWSSLAENKQGCIKMVVTMNIWAQWSHQDQRQHQRKGGRQQERRCQKQGQWWPMAWAAEAGCAAMGSGSGKKELGALEREILVPKAFHIYSAFLCSCYSGYMYPKMLHHICNSIFWSFQCLNKAGHAPVVLLCALILHLVLMIKSFFTNSEQVFICENVLVFHC